MAVRIGGSALILGLLLYFLPLGELWAAMTRISLALFLELLAVYMVLHLLGVVKWRLLINLAGADLTFLQATRCYYFGLFGNNFLPSLVGGDFVRAGMAFRMTRARTAVVLGSLIDRMQDVIGLAIVAGTGVLLLPQSLDPRSRRVFWALAGIGAVVGIAGGITMLLMPARRFPFKVRRMIVKIRTAMRSMSRRPGLLLFCLGLGISLQMLQVLLNSWMGHASGLHLAFGLWLFAWPLAKLSALLPVTFGGIGVREAALVALLLPFGASPVLVAAVGLIFEAITTIGGLIAGVIAFLIGRLSPAPALD